MKTGTVPCGNVRDSNMEALRILAMSMIIIHHFLVHVLNHVDVASDIVKYGDAWVYYGVNLFFMISGRFTVKCNLRAIVKLCGMVWFYNMIAFIVMHLMGYELAPGHIFRAIFFPVSEAQYWFLMVYFFILILSPLVNLGLKNMSDKSLTAFIVLVLSANFYSNALGFNFVNSTGYSFFQGLMMYVIGYWIARVKLWKRISISMCLALVAFFSLVSSLTKGLESNVLLEMLRAQLWEYNGICVIGGSVAIMLLFSKMDFKSRMVNSISTAALGCYLIQDGLLGYRFMYKWQEEFVIGHNILESAVMFGCSFIAIWCCSYVLTRIFSGLLFPILYNGSRRLLGFVRGRRGEDDVLDVGNFL